MNAKDYNKKLSQLDADILKNRPAAPALPDGVVLTCGSDLTPEQVRWLWQQP